MEITPYFALIYEETVRLRLTPVAARAPGPVFAQRICSPKCRSSGPKYATAGVRCTALNPRALDQIRQTRHAEDHLQRDNGSRRAQRPASSWAVVCIRKHASHKREEKRLRPEPRASH